MSRSTRTLSALLIGAGLAAPSVPSEVKRASDAVLSNRESSPDTATLFADLERQARKLKSVSLEAEFVVLRRDSRESNWADVPARAATLRFLASGDRYLSATTSDSGSRLAADTIQAWDGRTFYLYLAADDLLSVGTERPESPIQALPNPLLLYFDFLSQISDDCPGCSPSFATLSDSAVWTRARGRTRDARPAREERRRGGAAGAVVDGASLLFGRPHLTRVVGGREGGIAVVKQLTREDIFGSLISDLRFSNFQAGTELPGVVFPRSMELRVVGENGPESAGEMTAVITISHFAVNPPLDDSAFQLDLDRARRLWDSDSGMFLREGN